MPEVERAGACRYKGLAAGRSSEAVAPFLLTEDCPAGHARATTRILTCGATYKSSVICSADGKVLFNSPTTTNRGLIAISVADASATEGTDTAMAFTVRLSRFPGTPLTGACSRGRTERRRSGG